MKIILDESSRVLKWCLDLLNEVDGVALDSKERQEHLLELVDLGGRAIASFEAGHDSPAQSLATDIIDTMIWEVIPVQFHEGMNVSSGPHTNVEVLSTHYVFPPLKHAYKAYWAHKGHQASDYGFNRNVISHSARTHQFTKEKSIIAILNMVSIIVFSDRFGAPDTNLIGAVVRNARS